MAYQQLTHFQPPVHHPPTPSVNFASPPFSSYSLGYLTSWIPPVPKRPRVERPHFALVTPTEFATFPYVDVQITLPFLTRHPFSYVRALANVGYAPRPANFVATVVPAQSCTLNLGVLKGRLAEMLDNPFVYYTENEIRHAINVAQRLFCLITLCIERSVSFPLVNGQCFYTIDSVISDWIVPLRIGFSGVRLKTETLQSLDALSGAWRLTPGAPRRYVQDGFNLLGVSPQPASGVNALTVVYAAEPSEMIADSDFPEIPPEQQILLPDAAFYLLRLKEGGAELQAAVKYWQRFLEGAQKYQSFTRARSRAQLYDRVPPDLSTFEKGRWEIKLKNQTIGKPRKESG